jgi:hypothetical protein
MGISETFPRGVEYSGGNLINDDCANDIAVKTQTNNKQSFILIKIPNSYMLYKNTKKAQQKLDFF